MDSGGGRISLASNNVVYIKKDGAELTANTDETLWFSTENENRTYHFEVKTKDGKVYVADLDWTQGIPVP